MAAAWSLGPWLRLGRVSNLPTVWSNVLAGFALSGAAMELAPLLGLLVALSLFYVAGMYLNDAFDRDVDARERPERPIPSGAVRASTVFTAGFFMLGVGVAIVTAVAWHTVGAAFHRATLASLVLAGTIVLYDVYHKQNPLSPLLMGLCRVLVYVTVAFAARGVLPGAVVLGALALWCHLIGLTYAAKQENLARLRSVWPLAVLGLAPAYGLRLAFQEPRAAAFLALFAGWLVYSLRFLLSSRQRSIPGAVVRLIAGVALLDAVLIAATGAMELAVVAVAFCGVTRLLQRVVPGT